MFTQTCPLEFAGGAGREAVFVEAEEDELPDEAAAPVGAGAGSDFTAGAGFDEVGGADDAADEAEEESDVSLFLDFFLVEVSAEAELSVVCD